MLTIHITKGISETPDAAKAVFAKLRNISSAFDGIEAILKKHVSRRARACHC